MRRIFFLSLLSPLTAAALTQAQTLYIGDSHSAHSFGARLAEDLNGADAPYGDVDRFAVADTSVPSWRKAEICDQQGNCPYKHGYVTPQHPNGGSADEPRGVPGFAKLATVKHYSAYVIALGTNDANNSKCTKLLKNGQPTEYGQTFAALIQSVPKASACVWVGPPAYTHGVVVDNCGGADRYSTWVNDLETLVTSQGCAFARDPREPSKGYHFNTGEGKEAADLVFRQIEKLLPKKDASPEDKSAWTVR